VFLLAAAADIMTDWKHNIRKHYHELLKNIDTRNGLDGELIQLQSASFPLRAIWQIWVMIFLSAIHSTLFWLVGWVAQW